MSVKPRSSDRQTILLTGAGSPIGRVVAATASYRGLDVVRVFNPRHGADPGRYVADMRDTGALSEILASTRPDAVIHLAWIHQAPAGAPASAADENVIASRELAIAAKEAGVERFVLASSAAIYGDRYPRPVTEEDEPRPTGAYGAAKLEVERALESVATPESATVAARIFNVYGPGMDSSLVERLRRLGGGAANIELRGPENFVRDYIDVDDVANALVQAATRATAGFLPINVGSGFPTSNRMLADFFGASPAGGVRFVGGPTSYSCAVVDRAREVIGFVAKPPPWARLVQEGPGLQTGLE